MEIWKEGHGVQAKGGAEGGLLESQHCREGCLPSAGSLQLLFKAERSPPAPPEGRRLAGLLMGSVMGCTRDTAFAAINTWRMSSKQALMIGSELLICYSVEWKI